MKVHDIKEIAKQRGINPAKLKKTDLIRTIQTNEGNTPCYMTNHKEECGQFSCLWREDCI